MRRPRRRSGSAGWYATVALIVAVGVALIVITRSGKNTAVAAGRGVKDHWHAALGVNVCGTWQPNPPASPTVLINNQRVIVRVGTNVYAGLHTHGDGLIHFEPATSEDAGDSATVGRYFTYSGWKLSASSFTFLGVSEKDGDRCPGVGGKPAEKLGNPPSVAALPNAVGAERGNVTTQPTSPPTSAPQSSSSVPPSSSSAPPSGASTTP